MVTQKFTSIEFFAGAGGLSLGLEQACISPLMLLDSNYNSCQTLTINRPCWDVVHDTVENFACNNSLSSYQGVVLISAGFPCQPFSFIGKKEGFSNKRGGVIFSFF